MERLSYSTGNPTAVGVYACRVPYGDNTNLVKDLFLIWMDQWCYPSSDQRYRGRVLGWIGPLPRVPKFFNEEESRDDVEEAKQAKKRRERG
jgi:hypothetical protein